MVALRPGLRHVPLRGVGRGEPAGPGRLRPSPCLSFRSRPGTQLRLVAGQGHRPGVPHDSDCFSSEPTRGSRRPGRHCPRSEQGRGDPGPTRWSPEPRDAPAWSRPRARKRPAFEVDHRPRPAPDTVRLEAPDRELTIQFPGPHQGLEPTPADLVEGQARCRAQSVRSRPEGPGPASGQRGGDPGRGVGRGRAGSRRLQDRRDVPPPELAWLTRGQHAALRPPWLGGLSARGSRMAGRGRSPGDRFGQEQLREPRRPRVAGASRSRIEARLAETSAVPMMEACTAPGGGAASADFGRLADLHRPGLARRSRGTRARPARAPR